MATAQQSTQNFKGDRLSVKMLGAKGDTQTVINGVATAGSTVLTSAAGKFKASDVGKIISLSPLFTGFTAYDDPTFVVMTALDGDGFFPGMTGDMITVNGHNYTIASIGGGGATLTVSSQLAAGDRWQQGAVYGTINHVTTIAAYVSPTQVTLAAAPPVGSRGCKVIWGTDDTVAFQKAHDSVVSNGRTIFVPMTVANSYMITAQINITQAAVRFEGAGKGSIFSGPRIVFVSSAAQHAAAMFHFATQTTHGGEIVNLSLDANSKAGTCIEFQLGIGQTLKHPGIRGVECLGYTKFGVVIGDKGDVTQPVSALALADGQCELVHVDTLTMRGGVPGAIGILINAQNAEFTVFNGLYIDPPGGRQHTNHIYQRVGGISITGFVSTRASSYGWYSFDMFQCLGWRSEDRFLLYTASVAAYGPSQLIDVLQRGNDPANTPSDLVIVLNFSGCPTRVNTALLTGSIQIGSTAAMFTEVTNVLFPEWHGIAISDGSTTITNAGGELWIASMVGATMHVGDTDYAIVSVNPGAQTMVLGATVPAGTPPWVFYRGGGFVYSGPGYQSGIFHDVRMGDLAMRGRAVAFRGLTETGIQVWKFTPGIGGSVIRSKAGHDNGLALDTSSAGQNNYLDIMSQGLLTWRIGQFYGRDGQLVIRRIIGTDGGNDADNILRFDYLGNVQFMPGATLDATSATQSWPFIKLASLPTSPAVGDFVFMTGASPGLYECQVAGTWSRIAIDGGGGGVGIPFVIDGTGVDGPILRIQSDGANPFLQLRNSSPSGTDWFFCFGGTGGRFPTALAIADLAGNFIFIVDALVADQFVRIRHIGAGNDEFQVAGKIHMTAAGGLTFADGTTQTTAGIGGLPSVGTPGAQHPVITTDAQGRVTSSAGLPSVNPGAGTQRLWYDPADGNRVKYAP